MSHSNNDVKLTPAQLASLNSWASLPTTSHNVFDNAFNRHLNTSSVQPSTQHVATSSPIQPSTQRVATSPPPIKLHTVSNSTPSSPSISPSLIAKERELEMREERIRRVLELQKNASEKRDEVDRINVVHASLPLGVVHHGGLPLGIVHHGGLPFGVVHHGGLPFGVVHHGGLPFGVVHQGAIHHGNMQVGINRRANLDLDQRHAFIPTDNSVGLSRIAPHLVRF
jgi:hypothetical protein